ncbi:glycoside hydrolase family 5 protein [Legionella parisiensis]|uniref:Endoglucanase E-5 n=1 Tax=Legionella parisiensis TaxID=45071 RepID=A0A1E5JP35_9GAMM|nr:glycoside hydrolase family 5 protein [Legionella parisiensis]KTD41443.1 chitinase [Legionella parisiensis]OEH45798.1 Endoglucanase E-5 [Legionella parisiensis]STX76253.1 chitinase [Legionella parisiensis]
MRYHLLGLGTLIAIAQAGVAQPVSSPLIPQPTACISTQFITTGDQHWKSVTLKLTNGCNKPVDFQNATVTFKNSSALNTNFWGDFSPLPYPDNALNITSQAQTDGKYLATFNLHFPSYPGADSKLPIGSSIFIKYGVSSDTHIEGSTNVYIETPVETGTLILKNSTKKPDQVTQNYALVHLFMNGQKINDIQLAWDTTINVNDLAVGNYTLSADTVADGMGNTYQGSAVPNSFALTVNQQVTSTISYTKTPQTGKITINLQALPSELSGYSSNPTVLLSNQDGGSLTQTVSWNTSETVTQLKEGSMYQLSTAPINFNGYNCAPTFSPSSVVAGSNAPSTHLTYHCVQVAQASVTLNVTGGPATLSALTLTFTPNDGAAAVIKTVSLANGSGSDTVLLTDGIIYTVSSEEVAGYSVDFSPQPLTATANGIETITLTSQTGSTPLAINGQLTVCGAKLCNKMGNPIQLKGMSTHGLQWYGVGTCITSGSMDYLIDNLKANVIRLSLYVQEGGYETDPVKYTNQVNNLINEAYDRGIYVIVDWHILNPGDPNYNLTRAKKFFTDITTANKNKNNLLYEIANEPNGVSWTTIRNYAEQIIPVIRAIDPNAPILVGTRGWSSLGVSEGGTYQEIINNPVPFPNVMYTFHFYAASHREQYLNALDSASQVLPIFVTEFGTQTFSGDGANDFTMSDRYMQLMASKQIGWTNWNYSDDFRSGAIWKTNTCLSGAWLDSNLKPAGVYIKNKILTS